MATIKLHDGGPTATGTLSLPITGDIYTFTGVTVDDGSSLLTHPVWKNYVPFPGTGTTIKVPLKRLHSVV